MRKSLAALFLTMALGACNQSEQPVFETPPGPLDTSTAETMMMRSLQASEAGDVEAAKADLFPRQSTVLNACAKLRVDMGRTASLGMRDENGKVPAISGVTVSGIHQQGPANIFEASYRAHGNDAYSGSQSFIWANGRWWLRCNS